MAGSPHALDGCSRALQIPVHTGLSIKPLSPQSLAVPAGDTYLERYVGVFLIFFSPMCARDESPNPQQSEPKSFPSEMVEGRGRRGKSSLSPTPWEEDGGRCGGAAVLGRRPRTAAAYPRQAVRG